MGFSLVEVLVSIFILSVGIIGSAGLQLTAFRAERQAAAQTAALQLATEMADMIRALDRRHAISGFPGPIAGVSYQANLDGEPQAPGKLCYASRCSPSELAEFEIYDWKRRVKLALPAGRLLICHDATPWDNGKKSLSWVCHEDPDGRGPLVIKLGWQVQNPDGALATSEDGTFPPGLAITVGSTAL